MLGFLWCEKTERAELMHFVHTVKETKEVWRCSGCELDHQFKGKFANKDLGLARTGRKVSSGEK